jgi:putative heme-binding domain-containing protein
VNSKRPLARVHALYILDNLDALKTETLIAALHDEASGVRESALRIAEKHGDDAVVHAAAKLVDDNDAKVRLQLALSIGEWKQPAAGEALIRLAAREQQDPMMRGALVSSFLPHLSLLAKRPADLPKFNEPILLSALAEKNDAIVLTLVQSILEQAAKLDEKSLRMLRSTLRSFSGAGVSMESLAARNANDVSWSRLIRRKRALMDELKNAGHDREKPASWRGLTATVLIADPEEEAAAVALCGSLLVEPEISESFVELVNHLARSKDWRIPEILTSHWDERTPAQRDAILDVLMNREGWTSTLIAKIKGGSIAASAFDGQRQARLLKHPSADIRKVAGEIFTATANAPRAKVIEAFKPALSLKGDPAKGKAIFAQACIACHQLEGVGRVLGPDLRSVVGHDPDKLLNSILDPSANIEPGFTAYFCELKNGEQLYGIISGESGASIDFKLADASVRNLLRSDIVKLQSSKASLMPDGLEAALTPQSLADLIAYLKVPK